MTTTNPQITGIEYVAPKTTKFKFKDVNVFYVLGTNLAGLDVTALAGKLNNGNKPVTWTGVGTLSNTDPQKLLVKGKPEKGTMAVMNEVEEVAAGDDEKPPVGAPPDAGTITVTVTGGVTQHLPVDYEP